MLPPSDPSVVAPSVSPDELSLELVDPLLLELDDGPELEPLDELPTPPLLVEVDDVAAPSLTSDPPSFEPEEVRDPLLPHAAATAQNTLTAGNAKRKVIIRASLPSGIG